MLLIFVTLVLVFLAVYRASGDWGLDRLRGPLGVSVVLTVVLIAIRYVQHGYTILGTSGAWGWALAVTHVMIVIVVFIRGTYIVRKAVVTPPHPFLSAEDQRYLARRPMAWERARILILLSAVVVVAIGQPDVAILRSAVTAVEWGALCIAVGWIGYFATSLVRRRAGGRVREFVFAHVDPVGYGIVQLRVAERDSFPSLVEDLVDNLRRKIERISPRRRRHAQLVELLAAALVVRHRMTGSGRDLDDAITVGRSLLTMRPNRKDPERWSRRVQLATALQLAYLGTGDLQFLDESIRILNAVRIAMPSDSAMWSLVTSNLAVGRLERYVAADDVDALRESISLQRQAIIATPTEDYKIVLRRSARVILSPITGRAARRAARGAVGQALTNAHYLPHRLVNLGTALVFLHGIDEDTATLAEGVTVLRRALQAMPAEHTERPWAMRQLADALLVTQSLGGDPDGGEALLSEAATLLHQGLSLLPSDHPDAAQMQYLLGEVSHRRYDATGGEAHHVDAIEHWRRTCAVTTGLPAILGVAAQRWGDAAARVKDWDDAVKGYSIAVELLARRASRSLTRADQERTLGRRPGVVRDAAACAITARNPGRALELLELGRGILLSQTLDTRSDLSQLREQHPRLAADFVRVRDAFDQPSKGFGTDDVAPIVRRHALAKEWDELLTTIRSLDGFEGFLRPRDAAELVGAAVDGAIVMVNISDYRCDALILCDGAVHAVPLPDVTEDDVNQRVLDYLAATLVTADRNRSMMERGRAEADIRSLLAWLWDAITAPVLARVPDGLGRLWWVPSGALSFLPLHAAGHCDLSHPPASVFDLTTSSYTPTIRVLEHARAQSTPGVPSEALVVSVSAIEDYNPLPGAADEAAVVSGHFLSVRELTGPNATRVGVLAALADAPLVHFACHAYSDPTTASAGGLILHDTPLSVRDVDALRIGDGRLAFLSACATAQGSLDLLDETIHLTSAFQLAGYTHVIGTLWPTDDDTAAAVAEVFYDHLTQGCAPHAALHDAVRSLRASAPRTPSLWASYIHVGP